MYDYQVNAQYDAFAHDPIVKKRTVRDERQGEFCVEGRWDLPQLRPQRGDQDRSCEIDDE